MREKGEGRKGGKGYEEEGGGPCDGGHGDGDGGGGGGIHGLDWWCGV